MDKVLQFLDGEIPRVFGLLEIVRFALGRISEVRDILRVSSAEGRDLTPDELARIDVLVAESEQGYFEQLEIAKQRLANED